MQMVGADGPARAPLKNTAMPGSRSAMVAMSSGTDPCGSCVLETMVKCIGRDGEKG